MQTTLDAPVTMPVAAKTRFYPRRITQIELNEITERHNKRPTAEFFRDVDRVRGFPPGRPWDSEGFDDPVLAAFLNTLTVADYFQA